MSAIIEYGNHYDADVVLISDFRMPGGTSHSIAEEAKAQLAAGIKTALLHVPSQMIRRPVPWSRPIVDLLSDTRIVVKDPERSMRVRVAILRHPSVFAQQNAGLHGVVADQVVMVANHSASEADGTWNYDVKETDSILQQQFGKSPLWAPIGPVVRESILAQEANVRMSAWDWLNIIEQKHVPQRTEFVSDRPVIGRHSRPQAAKWPSKAREIREAYPLTSDYKVEILGGAQPVVDVLGKVPSRWRVVDFGGEEVAHFLSRIDFWVYFHHPQTREAYGRAIIEALQAGVVVILPEYLRTTYGDAAVYGLPADVKPLINHYWENPSEYFEQSARGQEFVRQLSPDLHTERLRSLTGVKPEARSIDPTATRPSAASREGRVLFVTSNGAGMGHLTRLLAVARRLPEGVKPAFASLSTGVEVLGRFNIPFEYISSSQAMGLDARSWNKYFSARIESVLATYDPDTVVFDGTVPYSGLLESFARHHLHAVWMRRGMWKPSIPGTRLGKERYFDLVIEPGELAASHDFGATSASKTSSKVGPVVLLDDSEVLTRDAARRELGYSDDEKVVLINLGAGNINDITSAQTQIVNWFTDNAPEWRLVLTKPPIATARQINTGQWDVLSTYPLGRFLRAFDIAVSASGYNSFHELAGSHVPTLWMPNTHTLVDDQVARARWAQERGLGVAVVQDGQEEIARGLEELTAERHRESMRERARSLTYDNGAHDAAALISRVGTVYG